MANEEEKAGGGGLPIAIGPLKLNLKIENIEGLRVVWEKYCLPISRTLAPLIRGEIDIALQKQLLRKLRNAAKIEEEANGILSARGATPEDISPSVSGPLMESAIDEEREGLRVLWAKLLAAAKDPNRRDSVRRDVIDAVKAMEPIDAIILASFHQQPPGQGQHLHNVMSARLQLGSEDVQVSIAALTRIGLIGSASPTAHYISPIGRMLMRAIAD